MMHSNDCQFYIKASILVIEHVQWSDAFNLIMCAIDFAQWRSASTFLEFFYYFVSWLNAFWGHIYVSHVMRELVYDMRTTKAQISLRIHTVWSAPLLFPA